jgi:hypothetical protein
MTKGRWFSGISLVAMGRKDQSSHSPFRTKVIEDRLGEPVVALGQVAPEINAELEAIGLQPGQVALQQILQILGDDAQDGGLTEILKGLDRRQGQVPARRGEKGHVITERLIAIGSAEVEDLGPTELGKPRVGYVLASRYDRGARDVELPVLWVFHDEEHGHDQEPFFFGVRTRRLAS